MSTKVEFKKLANFFGSRERAGRFLKMVAVSHVSNPYGFDGWVFDPNHNNTARALKALGKAGQRKSSKGICWAVHTASNILTAESRNW